MSDTYQPTDEQIEALARDDYVKWGNPLATWKPEVGAPWIRDAQLITRYPAFQSIIRAAQAEARDDAAAKLEAAVDLWRSDPDNWRFETDLDARNWLVDVASDMRAGRPIVLTDEEAADV